LQYECVLEHAGFFVVPGAERMAALGAALVQAIL